MRRLAVFALFLALLGLTTVAAAEFSVNAEDVTSFSTPVSLSIPGPPVVVETLVLREAGSVLPGFLDPSPDPTMTDPVRTKAIDPGTGSVQQQTAPGRYHSWETDPVPVGGLTLHGPVSLYIIQNGGTDTVTAALFDCQAAATPSSTGCTKLAGDASNAGNEGGGQVERLVELGQVSTTVPEGNRLRVQVANLSSKKWSIQWGYKLNRPARLEITVPTP